MGVEKIEKVRRFHQTFPQYEPTPLQKLDQLAKYFGVESIFLKDESYRFGLNSFKVLGSSFAMAEFIAQRNNRDISTLSYQDFISPKTRQEFENYTFYTASDGNHGRAVAWVAKQIGQNSVIYMPKGTSDARLQNILREGAQASITDMNYDDCVRLAKKESDEKPNRVLFQDTALEGFEEIPGWIMEGYGTMPAEAIDQIKQNGYERPTHVFVQAGVGCLAGSVVGYISNLYPENPPTMVIVEPMAADCFFRSAEKGDGNSVNVEGDMTTIMAGLACGEPNPTSWAMIKNKASFFVSMTDSVTARAMRVLAAPLKGDPVVISGESGAAGLGCVLEVLSNPDLADFKKELGLNEHSKILVFSSEGNTDPECYRRIIWDGYCSAP